MRAAGACLLSVLVLVAGCGAAPEGVGTISPAELAGRMESGDAPLVLDVRTPEEFAAGHIPGARNIPHDQLATRLDEVAGQRDVEVVVHCQSGRRAGMAEEVLQEAGFRNLRDLEGHWQAWQQGGYPVGP